MKNLNKNRLIGLFVLLAQPAFSQNTVNSLTLKEAVDMAITSNLQVKQAGLQVQNASVNYSQAKANRLPNLFGDLNQGFAQGRNIDPGTNSYVNQNISFGNYGLTTNVILFNGGQLKNIVKQNALGYEASKMELQQSKDDLALNVILAYLQILNNQELLLQSNNQLALTKNQVDRLDVLNKEGAIIPAQLYELRGQYANDEVAVITNRTAVESAKLALSQLLNMPYNKDLQVQGLTAADTAMVYSAGPAQIYEASAAQLSVIKAAQLRKQSALAGVKVARGQYYPTVSLGADLYTTYSSAASKAIFLNSIEVPSGDFVDINGTPVPVITQKSNFNTQKIGYADQFRNNYGTSVSLGVRIPILNGWQAKNRVALARTELKNREYIEETARLQLRQSVEQSYLNMNGAYERFQTLERQVRDFEAAYKIAEIRFNAGASNQVEYLIAKNNFERAQIGLITAKYDYVLRSKILDYYQGKLSY
jgi:outer membrane protein